MPAQLHSQNINNKSFILLNYLSILVEWANQPTNTTRQRAMGTGESKAYWLRELTLGQMPWFKTTKRQLHDLGNVTNLPVD